MSLIRDYFHDSLEPAMHTHNRFCERRVLAIAADTLVRNSLWLRGAMPARYSLT
jgi:hypothetical protein